MRASSVVVTIGTAVAAAALLAGCSHAATTAGPTAVATTSATASPPATAGGSSSAPTTGAASAPAAATAPAAGDTGASGTTPPAVSTGSAAAASGPGLCTPTVTRMDTEGGDGGAGGHFAFAVHVVNASSSPCVTDGYPGVALLDGSGREVEQAERTPSGYMGGLWDGSSPARIVLQPGEEATALVEGLNGNPTGPACASSPALLFTLPDNTDSTTLTHRTQVCDGLQIHPLVAGSSGTVGT